MSSTYSTNLQIELVTTGEQSGAWGSTTNNNLGILIEQAISGYAAITYADTDVVLQMTPGASATARNMYLELDGTNTAQRNLYVPANAKMYFIYNNTNNGAGYGIQVVVTGQTGGVLVPAGARVLLVCNGTGIAFAATYNNTLTLGTPLAVTSGGSGTSTSTGTGSLVLNTSPALSGIPTAPTAAAGTNTAQIATTAFVGALRHSLVMSTPQPDTTSR